MVDDDDVLRAYHQAVDAVQHAAERLPDGGAGAVVPFEDLGLSVLLDRLAEGPELGRFFEAELGPLLEHDRAHGSSLVADAAGVAGRERVEDGGGQAARRRAAHRLLPRRPDHRRSSAATSDNPETRLRLELAVRAWESLEALRTRESR